MSTLHISQHETGVVRVFAISRPMADMARALRQSGKNIIASELLGHEVSDSDIELFALADLAGLGLPRYLSDGYAVEAEALHADRARLEALDGYVLLLLSNVANTGTVTLTPGKDLTLIGTYREPWVPQAAGPIASEAAKLHSGIGGKEASAPNLRSGSMITGAILLLAFLFIWWILR